MPYRIVRHYFEEHRANRIIKTGLTLEQAQAHCSNPETSSRTCTGSEGKARTTQVGPWFDSYEEEA